MNIFPYGGKRGFTLLELMLAMVVMGIMAGFIIPMVQQLRPHNVQQEFARNVNELCAFAWQNALVTQKVHRVYSDLKARTMRIEVEQEGAQSIDKEPTFKQLKFAYASTQFTWPKRLEIKQFYINGQEKLQQIGTKTDAVWFYIVPDGLTQDVIINIVDTQQLDAQGAALKMGVTVNPFTAQVRRYDTFQKP